MAGIIRRIASAVYATEEQDMTADAVIEPRAALHVHRELLVLFVSMWALAALLVLASMQHELSLEAWAAVGTAVLLPLLGALALISGDFVALAFFGSLLVLLLLSWWASARWPASDVCKWVARSSVAAYWLVTWILAVLSA